MDDLNTKPLCGVKPPHGKPEEPGHSGKEFEEVLEDGLKLNDQVLQLKRQVEVQEQDNLALVKRNRELESENYKLKAMLAKARVDFLEEGPAPEPGMAGEPPRCKQHAMGCIDEMVEVFGAEAVKSYCMCNAWKYRYRAPCKGKLGEDDAKADWYLKKLSELNAASIFENEPDDI